MQSSSVIVKCKSGLHARPAASLMKTAKSFKSSVRISKDGKSCNAKSILEILSVNVNCQDQVEVVCEGEDEAEAMKAILAILETELD